MLSKVSVDEAFMRYFQYVRSFWGLHPHTLTGVPLMNPAGKRLNPKPFNLPTPGKNPVGANDSTHGQLKVQSSEFRVNTLFNAYSS